MQRELSHTAFHAGSIETMLASNKMLGRHVRSSVVSCQLSGGCRSGLSSGAVGGLSALAEIDAWLESSGEGQAAEPQPHSFNAQPKAPACFGWSVKGAGAFGWALNGESACSARIFLGQTSGLSSLVFLGRAGVGDKRDAYPTGLARYVLIATRRAPLFDAWAKALSASFKSNVSATSCSKGKRV